jgi:hypothetical protein
MNMIKKSPGGAVTAPTYDSGTSTVLTSCPGGGACRVVGYAAHIRFFDVLTAFWVYAC